MTKELSSGQEYLGVKNWRFVYRSLKRLDWMSFAQKVVLWVRQRRKLLLDKRQNFFSHFIVLY